MTAARPETGATEICGFSRNEFDELAAILLRTIAENSTSLVLDRHLISDFHAFLTSKHKRIALAEHVVSIADREAIGRCLKSLIDAINFSYLSWEDAGLKEGDLARLERLRGSSGEGTT